MKYLEESKQKYGQRTMVLMQVGCFYEFYGVDNAQVKIGNIKELTAILNIPGQSNVHAITINHRANYRPKDKHYLHIQAGFPCNSIGLYITLLLKHGYTIVVIDQTQPITTQPLLKSGRVDAGTCIVFPLLDHVVPEFIPSFHLDIYQSSTVRRITRVYIPYYMEPGVQQEIKMGYIERQSRPGGELYHSAKTSFYSLIT